MLLTDKILPLLFKSGTDVSVEFLRPNLTRWLVILFGAAYSIAGLGVLGLWLTYGQGTVDLVWYTVFLVTAGLLAVTPLLHFLVVRPVRDVMDVINDAIRGDRLLRLDYTGRGELSTLAKGVNQVIDQLEHRELGLTRSLQASDIAYRMAKVGTHSFDVESAQDGIRDALGDIYPGLHTWFITAGKPMPAVNDSYRRLAAEADTQGCLVHGESINAWQVAIPVMVGATSATIMVLYSAIDNEYPDDAMVQTLASHSAMALSSASNYHRATTDGLTGMHNKQHGFEWLNQVMAEALRYGQVASVLALDIDFFKKVNDTYGHSVGDDVLSRVSSTLRGQIRAADICIRNGGEEFLIILPHTTGAQAVLLAEKLRAAIAEQAIPVLGEDPIQVTISIGAAELANADTVLTWVDRADHALYSSKHEGRNRVTLAATTLPAEPEVSV